ncbi:MULTISPECIES: hypothetical protein [Microcystis]|jgi:hypothetical protein|uniref:Uncharacterized protein n=1 Tax=Microcystis aeruginosa NIES-3787 TaxID=2517782 RepID=A0A6H9FTV5_MICAE|nr:MULTISPECIES: hypothetical protein [Microcystis]MCA2818033.1 hypothetical protein [Microcystis sp. M085S1]MCA2857555.1 hypothetical protein [Microcystis sp. M065S1]MCA2630657.1 hypothetical protein [Microcystis sp. M091S2]MCA2647609.1 hypothetical protein [Microcystis sp. M069S2]MCA2664966.1 hypothetical protein [Microcystis sp. M064S2]
MTTTNNQERRNQLMMKEIIPFDQRLNSRLNKQKITILQVNLGKRCN